MMFETIGHAASGSPLFCYRFGEQKKRALILATTHGNEPESTYLAWALLEKLKNTFNYQIGIDIIPIWNVDGFLKNQRCNGSGVDLNRNFPTQDWTEKILNPKYPPGPSPASEPETKALLQFIKLSKPFFIFNLHSWQPLINTNGNCESVAKILSHWTGYTISPTIGYPTPGSLGTYGIENHIPVLTYELERGATYQQVAVKHLEALHEAIKSLEQTHA